MLSETGGNFDDIHIGNNSKIVGQLSGCLTSEA